MYGCHHYRYGVVDWFPFIQRHRSFFFYIVVVHKRPEPDDCQGVQLVCYL